MNLVIIQALDKLGPFADFGVKNASMSVEATVDPSLTLTITGSPKFPTISENTNEVAKFFVDTLSDVEFSLSGKMTSSAICIKLGAYVNMSTNSSLFSFHETGVFFSCE